MKLYEIPNYLEKKVRRKDHDEDLTQTMKDLILSTLQAKIDLFANL